MKRSNKVSSSRRKQRLRHFAAPSSERRRIMSCTLAKELRQKYGVRSLPIRKGDEIKILKGKAKGKTGKVVQVYRKKWCIHVDKVQRDKQNGQSVFLPLKPDYCVIEKIHLNKDRKSLLERRSKDKSKAKNKYAAKDVNMGGVS
jgi:large subunit ribosomal protein L26e